MAIAKIPVRSEPPEAYVPSPRDRVWLPAALQRFFMPLRPHTGHHHPSQPWHRVLWLTGVDYFSTLGYQPGIAFLAAGALSPLATLVLVVVTLGGALPIYAQVARRSHAGQGSIAMLERLLPGWKGKIFVLALLGFATTDFVITMTLSAADAATHAVHNPLLHGLLGNHHIVVTLVLLALLAAVFLRGFSEAIGVAVAICIPYLLLNAVVIGRGLYELTQRPEVFSSWRGALALRGDATALLLLSVLTFPRLALGMSGFETGVSVMPLIKGDEGDTVEAPAGRIRNTRKMLTTAALIMSVLLLGSSLVTTLLVPAKAMAPGGKASGRALAWLAHELLGNPFGTAYDFCTILILWFAGASAMAGMLNLVPRYLPRFGMAPKWVGHERPLVAILFAIDVVVTVIFRGDVDAQGGAYATGVLALMLSAAVAVALALWREARHTASATRRFPWLALYFWLVSGVFAYTFVDNVVERPDGVIISSIFIGGILLASALSRLTRSRELRIERPAFADEPSRALWEGMRGKKINLVPLRHDSPVTRTRKRQEVRRTFHAEGRVAYLHVSLADDRSEFAAPVVITVALEDGDFLISVAGGSAIPNTIAWVSEQLDPIAIYLDLSLESPVSQAFKFLLWGEGEVGIMVYQILVRYWRSTPEDDVRPKIFLISR